MGTVFQVGLGLVIDFGVQSEATPLCLAVEHSGSSAIKLLLGKGANVNASWLVPAVGVVLTPLSLAAFCGREDLVPLLVEAGANINAENKVLVILVTGSRITLTRLLK